MTARRSGFLLSSQPVPYASLNFLTGRYVVAGRGVVAFSDIIQFSRPSEAPYITAAKSLAWAGPDIPAYDHNPTTGALLGLRLGEQRPQLFASPGDLTVSPWLTTQMGVTKNYAIGADGTMSASRLTPTAVSSVHSFGQTITFANRTTYDLGAYFGMDGYRYICGSLPTAPFADARRAAVFDLQTGVVSAKDPGVIFDIEPGPHGLWLCHLEPTSAAGGSGNPGWAITTNGASTTPTTFTGNGGGIIINQPWLAASTEDVLLSDAIRSNRETDNAVLLFDDGAYDLFILCNDGQTTILRNVSATEGAGIQIPLPLPNGARCIQALTAYLIQQTSVSFQRQQAPDDLPAPSISLRSTDNVTISGGKVTRWDSVGGAAGFASQATSAAQATVATVSGKQLIRVQAANFMPLTNVPRATPTVITVLMAFRPLTETAMTVLGCEDVAGAIRIQYGQVAGCVQASITTGYAMGVSPPVPDDGSLIFMAYTVAPPDFRSMDLNGAFDVDLSLGAGASPLAAKGTPTLWRQSVGVGGCDIYMAEYVEYPGNLTQAQRERAMTEMQARWAGVAVPSSFRISAGATMPGGFRARGDVSGTTLGKLIVATDSALTSRIFTSPTGQTPIVTQGRASTYHSLDLTATGLDVYAGTRVYYAFELDGVVDLTKVQSVKLANAPGAAVDVTHALLSCTKPTSTGTITSSLEDIAAFMPDRFEQIGDTDYPTGLIVPTPAASNDLVLRGTRNNPGGAAVYAVCAADETPDDHDYGVNNFSPNRTYGTIPGTTIRDNYTTQYLSVAPSYPLADSQTRVLAFSYVDGPKMVIRIDTRSQRDTDLRIVLGNPALQPGAFDQMAWIKGELDRAQGLGVRRIWVQFPTGTPFPGDEAFVDISPQELQEIYDYFINIPVPIACETGDYHALFTDSGRITDYSSNQGATVPFHCSSPGYHTPGAAGGNAALCDWNGTLTYSADKTRAWHYVTTYANGDFQVVERVRSTSSSPIVMQTRRTCSTRDRGTTVGVYQTTIVPLGTLALEKTWQNLTPCSVDYAWTDVAAPSGTATWGPNMRWQNIVAPTALGTYTLTLSNPVNCTLPATVFTITVAQPAALTAFLASGLAPPTPQWTALYDALYYGLLGAGLTTKLDRLTLFNAGDSQISRVNMLDATGPYTMTVVGAMAYTPGIGWASTGGQMTVPYNPGLGGTRLTSTSAMFGHYQVTNNGSTAWAMGASQCALNGRNSTDGLCYNRCTISTNQTVPVATAIGHRIDSRLSAARFTVYVDHTGTIKTQSNGTLINEPWISWGRAGDTRVLLETRAYEVAGQGLTDGEVQTFLGLMDTFIAGAAALA